MLQQQQAAIRHQRRAAKIFFVKSNECTFIVAFFIHHERLREGVEKNSTEIVYLVLPLVQHFVLLYR